MEFQVQGTKAEIYSKLKEKLQGYVDAGKLPYIKGIAWNDASCSGNVTGPGFKAVVQCRDGGASMQLDLGIALRLMKGKIEAEVQKTVQKIFG
jgi:hypothetical protein